MNKELFYQTLNEKLDADSFEPLMDFFRENHGMMTHEFMRELFGYCRNLLTTFKFNIKSEEEKETYQDFLRIAICSTSEPKDGDCCALRRLKRYDLNEDYCNDNKQYFDRKLYLDCKETLYADLYRYRHYFDFFIDSLNTDDCQEFFESVIKEHAKEKGWAPYPSEHAMQEFLERGLVPEHLLEETIRLRGFRYLKPETRDKYAELGLKLSPYNFKHLSELNRIKLAHKIDFFEYPMLVAFNPYANKIGVESWKKLVEKDPRSLRFVPGALLSDPDKFSDDYLFALLDANQRYLSARYKLLSFIRELAPERINLEFCLRIKAAGIHELNHLVVVKELKKWGMWK